MGTSVGKMRRESEETVKISSDEYAMIKSIWRRIEFEPQVHGTGFYLRVFAKHPQYIKYFLSDPIKDDVNPDALMSVKFTVIIEVLGYLILDFHNKPKQFNQLIGYIGIMHKDMNLEYEDINNFFTALIDYLKDAMSDLMTDTCESVFVTFFRNIQELMMNSMEKERLRFADEKNENTDYSICEHSSIKSLVPCAWFNNSNKLIYGQPREYWIMRRKKWELKMRNWEQEQELHAVSGIVNIQNIIESSSSDEEVLEAVKEAEDQSDKDMQNGYTDQQNKPESIILQRAKYLNTGRMVSIPYFEPLVNESLSLADENEEAYIINTAKGRSITNVTLTPRERHRSRAAATKNINSRTSTRLISSTDTGSTTRYSSGSSARERRRSTWN